MKVLYLNTDLELESPNDLSPIVEHFGEEVINLYNGKIRKHFFASFEISGFCESPDFIIQQFCQLAESLEGKEKNLWDGCYSRTFDIGYEGGTYPSSYTDEIRVETLERVAALGASLRITVYPMDPNRDIGRG